MELVSLIWLGLVIVFLIVEASCPIHLVSVWFAVGSLVALAVQALKEGNADDLQWYCWCMHLKYMLLWREMQDAL